MTGGLGCYSGRGRVVADLLNWCSFMAGGDMGEEYHASVFPGYTGELVWGWGVVGVEDYEDEEGETGQRFVRGWRLNVGCWPWDCLQICEKSCSGACLDSFFLRWAVAHFGQKCAGSPLNVIALCLLRYLARRGAGRSSSARAIQGGVWVEDFIFASAVPRHPPCQGLVGGCQVCAEAYISAKLDHEFVIDLGEKLGIGFQRDKNS